MIQKQQAYILLWIISTLVLASLDAVVLVYATALTNLFPVVWYKSFNCGQLIV